MSMKQARRFRPPFLRACGPARLCALLAVCLLSCMAPAAAGQLPVLGLQPAASAASASAKAGLAPLAVHRNSLEGIDGLGGAADIAVAPDSRRLYVTGTRDDALSVWRIHTGSGSPLEQLMVYKDGAGGIDGLSWAGGIALNRSGRRLFVTASGDKALSVWRVNTADDNPLTLLKVYKDGADRTYGLQGAWHLALGPDGRRLYVSSLSGSALSVWRVNAAADNPLTWHKTYRDNTAGGAIALSPDGTLALTLADPGHALGAWRVNADAGNPLTLLRKYAGGTEGIDGLLLGTAVAFGLNGRRAYITAAGDDALSVWHVAAADASTSVLMQTRLYTDGKDGIDGLFSATDVVLSADGARLYAAGFNDRALSAWHVNDDAAAPLAQGTVYKDSKHGIDGLAGAKAIAVSPDGRLVFVASAYNNARNPDNMLSVWSTSAPHQLPVRQPLAVRVAATRAPGRLTTVTVTARLGRRFTSAQVLLGPAVPAADALFPAGLPTPGLWLFSAAAQPPGSLHAGAARAAVEAVKAAQASP